MVWYAITIIYDDMMQGTMKKGCSIIEKILFTIILVNVKITIIQTILFEFENMMHLFSISQQKKTF